MFLTTRFDWVDVRIAGSSLGIGIRIIFYDACGRMTSRTTNPVTTKYTYRYGDKLYSVDLNNDGTPEVT